MLIFILTLIIISISCIYSVYAIELLSTIIAIWVINLCYPINDNTQNYINKLPTDNNLIEYLQIYNPLIDYYDTIPMTIGDKQFVNKIVYNSPLYVNPEQLSGIMLMKIYFKRNLLKRILNAHEFNELMSYATEVYDIYTTLCKKFKRGLFIPDMYGYRNIHKKNVLDLDETVVQLNEMFYFNICKSNYIKNN